MQRKPGETIQELAARIRQDATTCAFIDITDLLDEPLRTIFICSVNNEAVLKALFKVKDNELNFNKAIQVAQETEEAAKVAKETVYGNSGKVNKVAQQKPRNRSTLRNNITADKQKEGEPCYRCDRTNHTADDCRFKTATCNFCSKQGHIERACRKMKSSTKEKLINMIESTQTCTIGHQLEMVKLAEDVRLKRDNFTLELDTGACDNFISKST